MSPSTVCVTRDTRAGLVGRIPVATRWTGCDRPCADLTAWSLRQRRTLRAVEPRVASGSSYSICRSSTNGAIRRTRVDGVRLSTQNLIFDQSLRTTQVHTFGAPTLPSQASPTSWRNGTHPAFDRTRQFAVRVISNKRMISWIDADCSREPWDCP